MKTKRSIKHGDVPPYRGPEQIYNYYNAANEKILRKVFGVTTLQDCPYPEDSQRHFLTLWMGGPREQEAVMLEVEKYGWNEEALAYYNMPVLKKREQVKDGDGNLIYKEVLTKVRQQNGTIEEKIVYRPLTRRKLEYRDVLIPSEIPLFKEFTDMIQYLRDGGYKYVLFKRMKFSREPVKDEPTTTRTVQNRINELHPDLFPHLIRPLHARFLRAHFKEKGENFDGSEIKEYFRWSTLEMADLYLGADKMAKLMGIRELPKIKS